jgi:transcriptional regulator with XRE-family HTH domain
MLTSSADMPHAQTGDFAGLIRHLRQERGWTQEQLAQRSGLTVRSVSNLERSVTRPAPETVDKLAAAFGLAPADIDPRRLADIVNDEASSLPRRQAIRRLLALPDRDIEAILQFLDERKATGKGRSRK